MDRFREEIIRMLIESALRPTGIRTSRTNLPEKMAWLELEEDVLDEAYDNSKAVRKYE
jgi:hypothetical protein